MPLTGRMLIAGRWVEGDGESFVAVDPSSGAALAPDYRSASTAQVGAACTAAGEACAAFRESAPTQRADFLRGIAANLMALGDDLIERVMAETGLPRPRVEGERARTANQLRLFADLLSSGTWQEVRIDPALPDRSPAPRPDLRLRKIGLGPVAMFGASNFPLAFSVAGGDTASALAAGCPVVVKGHPAHPGTSELVAGAVLRAIEAAGLPAGIFSLVAGAGNAVGEAMVSHSAIRAVAFTGSRGGGLALAARAAARPDPIPVFAEMSSINPVIIFPGALERRGAEIASGFAAALTLGVGQFCTNPGLVLVLDGRLADRFESDAANALRNHPPAPMLTSGICSAYRAGAGALAAHPRVETLARVEETAEGRGAAALFRTDAQSFMEVETIQNELFGPAGVVVRCADAEQLRQLVVRLEGQLTFSLHIEPEDYPAAASLLPLLEEKAGRIVVNAFGTGVEVSHAMVHGGPFPATSDPRFTSVGSLAIDRFLRPVCYQDLPPELLPEAVRDGNPLGLLRRIDGVPGGVKHA